MFFLAAIVASGLLQVWLSLRHIAHVQAGRVEVPQAFREHIPLAAHRKAADYTVTGTRFALVELAYNTALLLAWTLGGGLEWLGSLWQAQGWSPLWTGVAILVSAFTLMALLELPLTIYHTFVIEQRYGFNRSTARLFIQDSIKHMMLGLFLGVPFAALILWLMQVAGVWGWLYVWAVWLCFGLLMMWAYPAFIAPLFNKFTTLSDTALELRIKALLTRCGFTSKGIMVMDGSRRSGHGNAYFTGLGNNKRIVFFDTLIRLLDTAEIEAVLAHELGHFRRRHIQKRLLSMAVVSFFGLMLLGWLLQQPWFYTGLGVSTPSAPMGLLLFLLSAPVFGFLLQPLTALISRRHEFEADDYAAEQADAGALIRALVKLYRDNASTLTPDPLYSAFHDSHPPAPVRIDYLSRKLA